MINSSIFASTVALSTLLLGWMSPLSLAGAELPKVVLVGDSIRLGYSPTVSKKLTGKAQVSGPRANGGDSNNVLKHLDEWVIRESPAFVLFNCGIHDTKKTKATGKFQVPADQYEANLRKIVSKIRAETKAIVLFATTTPILSDRAAKTRSDRDYELLGESVAQYNEIAAKVMRDLNVPVLDLHAKLMDPNLMPSLAELITDDGVHYHAKGQELLGTAVGDFIEKRLPGGKN